MKDRHDYVLHNLLKIRSNFPSHIPDKFKISSNFIEPDIIFTMEKLDVTKRHEKGDVGIAPTLYYNKQDMRVISEINIPLLKIKYALSNFLGTPTKLSFNKNYKTISNTLLKLPISTLYPLNAYLQMIIHLKLILLGHTFLPGASFIPDGKTRAFILASLGGMGKTTALVDFLKKYHGKFISDDMIIINSNGDVLSYPKPMRIRKRTLGPFSSEKYVSVEKVINSENIAQSSKVHALCILEYGEEGGIFPVDKIEMSKKILAISRKLLPYYMERTITSYSYMDPDFDLTNIMKRENEIVRNFLGRSKNYIIRYDQSNYRMIIEMIKEIIDDLS